MLKYIISSLLLFFFLGLWAQEGNEISADSIVQKERYGLRIGVDVSKAIRSQIEDNYTGLELLTDYRLFKRIYLAGEIGSEEKTVVENNLDFITKGTYIKLGIDFNTYRNWVGMENMIYVGLRFGSSKFDHTLNSYTIYNTSQYWSEPIIDQGGETGTFSDLDAQWVEFLFGVKTELFRNLYMGINLQLKRLMSEKHPDNFDNLYIPGFNKVLDDNNIGVGIGYSITYQIPLFKRTK